ncbi:MAG: peptidoglycan DD-metalloendopeptidase family protein [Bacteroidota bacterium]
MEQKREHRKTGKLRLIVIPEAKGSESAKSFSVHPFVILLSAVVMFFIIAAIVIVLLIYTPVGSLIPITTSDVQRRYQQQISDLESRLQKLTEIVDGIREYNLKLRKALGESVNSSDSIRLRRTQPQALLGSGEEELWQPETRSVADQRSERTFETQSVTSLALGELPQLRRALDIIPLSVPVVGYVTQGFNPQDGHFGIDIAARRGTPVTAAAEGVVLFAGWTYDSGNMVILSHGQNILTFYKHNQSLLAHLGERVNRGEPIALLGDSGHTSMGPHLHFEVWIDGHVVDPSDYVFGLKVPPKAG